MNNINLKQLLRDIFFFLLWIMTTFLVMNYVHSPNANQNIPVDLDYEMRE